MPVAPILAGIGGGSALAGGLAVAGTAASVYNSVSQANAAKKAAAAASQGVNGGPPNQVDINALDAQTRAMALRNATDSQALEQRLTPEVAALKKQSIQDLLDKGGSTNYADPTRASLFDTFNSGNPIARSSLFDQALKVAGEDLSLGGALPQDVQNQILRAAGAKAASVGGGGLQLGRDVGARDLGLSSLSLRNQRLVNAGNLGSAEMQFNSQQANYRAQLAQLISQIGGQDTAQRLGIAGLAQGIQSPIVGLDPSAAANLAVGNQNVAQSAAANAANIAANRSNQSNSLLAQLVGGLATNYKGTAAPLGAPASTGAGFAPTGTGTPLYSQWS